MIKLLFYQGFSRKKTELLLLFMIKISQNITLSAKCRKELIKNLLYSASLREKIAYPKSVVCCLLCVVCCVLSVDKKRRHLSMTSPISW